MRAMHDYRIVLEFKGYDDDMTLHRQDQLLDVLLRLVESYSENRSRLGLKPATVALYVDDGVPRDEKGKPL